MSKLAINGGSKFRRQPFIEWPVHDQKEVAAVTQVIESGKWWRFAYGEGVELREKTSGADRAQCVLFQEEFARYHEAKYGLACANGTAAIEIGLKALGIGPGDEVIVPSYTYVGTATAVLQVNAIPIFVDIDPRTYNMDPARVEEAITDRTRAIVPVHFAGQSVDMDALQAIARKHKLFVVEDAAHAHGSEWKGRKVGAIGDLGTFSFQASKTMTAGEGGAIVTNKVELARLCDSYIWAGREVGRPWYEFYRLGWNYRMTELQGAVLRVQLSRLEEQVERRMQNAAYLTQELAKIEGIEPLYVDPRTTKHGYYIYMLKFKPEVWGISKDLFMDALIAEGLEVFKGYIYPLYKNPMFLEQNFYPKGCPVTCQHYGKPIDYAAFEKLNPVSEKACKEEAVWFKLTVLMGDRSDIDDVVGAIKKVQANLNELKNR